MKRVKIQFAGFWPGFDPEALFITKILRRHYHVEITDDADYVICSGFGFYDYLGHEQIRIFFSGENYIPDFNFVDYAFSLYPITFLDRHCTVPGALLSSFDTMTRLQQKSRDYAPSILKEKPLFANMIASHESERNLRGELVRLLSRYRRVEAAGSYLNNMPDGKTVKMDDGSKFALQKQCKFTLCCESLAHEGFVTEKLFDAFCADTIPVYYGSSTVSDIFNKDAYIDVRDYDSLEAVADRILELDSCEDQYLQMLRQPVFSDDKYIERKMAEIEDFVCHIFDQPMEQAYRRSRQYMPARYEQEILREKKARQDPSYGRIPLWSRKKEALARIMRERLNGQR
ncbi:MAG: hypothetical protein IJE81_01520 [Oscillospiraceae bacterium]|nr:hypothetical protein [Oscillospiraceae bacterium]MBQ7130159.1 hypothetical protein [Oscillospiraceae bacterium]